MGKQIYIAYGTIDIWCTYCTTLLYKKHACFVLSNNEKKNETKANGKKMGTIEQIQIS